MEKMVTKNINFLHNKRIDGRVLPSNVLLNRRYGQLICFYKENVIYVKD